MDGMLMDACLSCLSLQVLKKICDHPALLSERAASAVIAGGHR